MKKVRRIFNQASIAVIIAIFTSAFVLPFILTSSSQIFAGTFEPRMITMSNSAPGATSVTYTVAFTLATTGTAVQGVVIDFCANDTIINDTCTLTGNLTGFSLTGTPSVAETGLSSVGSWTATSANPYHTLIYTDSTATTTGQTSAVTVTISGVTNPTPTAYPGQFYARIFTYSSSTSASSYTSTNDGSNVLDTGGAALDVVQTINVAAKVFEDLQFCVYSTACGSTPTANLGVNSTSLALSVLSTYGSSNVAFQLGTNALSGVYVTMTGTTLCSAGTLTWANCEGAGTPPTITAMGSSAIAPVAGNSQFGMCTGGISGLTPALTYTSSTNACPTLAQYTAYTPGSGLIASTTYGFNDINTGGTCGATNGSGSSGTNQSCGSTVMTSGGPVAFNTGSFTFIANVSPSTPIGSYTANLNMVASSKF
jgi:hypothetical protein